MDLRKRIKLLKLEEGFSYKKIADESGVPYMKLLRYIEGQTKKLSKENTELINNYLDKFNINRD